MRKPVAPAHTARDAAIVAHARTPGATLALVGAVHGLSRERVRRIVTRAGYTDGLSHGQTREEWLARITELAKQSAVTSWRDISGGCWMRSGWARAFAEREDPGIYVCVSAILEERRYRRSNARALTARLGKKRRALAALLRAAHGPHDQQPEAP